MEPLLIVVTAVLAATGGPEALLAIAGMLHLGVFLLRRRMNSPGWPPPWAGNPTGLRGRTRSGLFRGLTHPRRGVGDSLRSGVLLLSSVAGPR